MDTLLPTILQNTYTLSSLKHKLNILKAYLLHQFFGVPSDEKEADWIKGLPLQNISKDNVYEVFKSMEQAIAKLPTLTIYLTFEADDQSLAQIGIFARKAYLPSLLLDIKYDPNLIAGCSLVWKGVYKDYSLRAKIEEKKQEILTGFKKYLR